MFRLKGWNFLLSYPRKRAAFCQMGLASTAAENCWTKSRNMQQKGASTRMTTKPARICQMPATMQIGENEMQVHTPKKMATERRSKTGKNLVSSFFPEDKFCH